MLLEQRHGGDALADGGGLQTSLVVEMTMVTWLWVLVRGGADCAWERPVSDVGIWKNFLFYVACLVALFALGNLDTSPSPSFLSVLVLVFGCCLWSTAYWIFRDACATWFNNGYTFYERLWTNFSIFYVAANSNPDSVCSPSGLNGQVCRVDASGCSFSQRGSRDGS